MEQEEIWKDIKGYENRYQVSNLGNVKSLNYNHTGKEQLLKPGINTCNYYFVNLYKNKKINMCLISRLVALTFIDNPENKQEVDHINTIRTDNRVENLRWVSHKENCNNEVSLINFNKSNVGKNLGKKRSDETKQKIGKSHSKPINQYTKEGEFIREWESGRVASDTLKIHKGHIASCCAGKEKTAGGFIWKHKIPTKNDGD